MLLFDLFPRQKNNPFIIINRNRFHPLHKSPGFFNGIFKNIFKAGQRLKHIINLLNLTQSEVADHFGINRSLLSQIYNEKQQISKLFMYALKAEFNINPAWLLTG